MKLVNAIVLLHDTAVEPSFAGDEIRHCAISLRPTSWRHRWLIVKWVWWYMRGYGGAEVARRAGQL